MKNFALAALAMAVLSLSPAKAADQVCPWVVTSQELVTLRTPSSMTPPTIPLTTEELYHMLGSGQLIVVSEILLKDPQILELIRQQFQSCLKTPKQ